MQRSPFSRLFAFLSTLALCAGLASCGSSTKESDGAAKKSGGKLNVATSFYPVQWLVQQIGGDKVTATSVTPANVEPHDYEISPAQIAKLGKVDALVYV
ncbi:metal ABC transporter substrate-binding protein, partial [Peptidiphaga sp.]